MDKTSNDFNKGTAQVKLFGDKVKESKLRWFGHFQMRDSGYTGLRILKI